MGRFSEDEAVRKHLKVFAGGLPMHTQDQVVGQHFNRYGQILQVSIPSPKDGDGKQPYAFVTFKYAADADCAVVDPQHFPGSQRPLAMGFATPRKKDAQDAQSKAQLLSDSDPCKVFVGGIGERDSEDEVGDFFSQWGLVVLVYRDKNWGFVHFASREGALRLLEEGAVVYQRRRVEVKASDSRRAPMVQTERDELIRRAIARHFHKKTMMHAPPQGMPAIAGPAGVSPAGYPPPAGYYGYPPPTGYQPPAAYPPPQGGYPPPQSGYPPPAGYPPQSGGYPPSSYPPPGAYPQQGPPPAQAGYYGAPPEPQKALPAPDYGRSGPPPPDQYGSYGRPASDPYGAPPPADPHRGGGGYPPDPHRDDRRRDDYYHQAAGAYPPEDRRHEDRGPPPPTRPDAPGYSPSSDPYYRSAGPPQHGAPGAPGAPSGGGPPPQSAGYYGHGTPSHGGASRYAPY